MFKTKEEAREYFSKYRAREKERIHRIQKRYRESPRGRSTRAVWKAKNTDAMRLSARSHAARSRAKFRAIWGYFDRYSPDWKQRVESSEKLGGRLLRMEGYDVLKTNWHFPFDFVAKKEEKTFFADVTMDTTKRIRPHQQRLLEFLGFELFVIFIKPDLTLYRIVKHDIRNHTTSVTSRSPFGRVTLTKENLVRIMKETGVEASG